MRQSKDANWLGWAHLRPNPSILFKYMGIAIADALQWIQRIDYSSGKESRNWHLHPACSGHHTWPNPGMNKGNVYCRSMLKNGLKVVTVWFYVFDGSSISKQICHAHTHIFLWFLSFSYIILVVIPQARYPEPVCNLIKEKRVGTYLWGHSSAWSPTNVADWNKEIPLAISLS